MTPQFLLILKVFLLSLIVSAAIKYGAPDLINLELLALSTQNYIALSMISLPVLMFAVILRSRQ